MNKSWILIIFVISFCILAIISSQTNNSLMTYFARSSYIHLKQFENNRPEIKKSEQENFKIWESVLTGKSIGLNKKTKIKYSRLGLNHLFTPSGFHLSALLLPLFKIFRSISSQLTIFSIIGIILLWTPGQEALKRMLLIKFNQKLIGQKAGFIFAISLDILFGSFKNVTTGFTFSFLFLGIIYSGAKGIGIIFWFFIAQLLIAYFLNLPTSPLLIIFSPLLNFYFALIMPALFLLAFPLYHWQLNAGLWLIQTMQTLVDYCYNITTHFPVINPNIMILIIVLMFINRKFILCAFFCLVLSDSVNIEKSKPRFLSRYELADGEGVRCKQELIVGYWYKKCSPLRGSTRK